MRSSARRPATHTTEPVGEVCTTGWAARSATGTWASPMRSESFLLCPCHAQGAHDVAGVRHVDPQAAAQGGVHARGLRVQQDRLALPLKPVAAGQRGNVRGLRRRQQARRKHAAVRQRHAAGDVQPAGLRHRRGPAGPQREQAVLHTASTPMGMVTDPAPAETTSRTPPRGGLKARVRAHQQDGLAHRHAGKATSHAARRAASSVSTPSELRRVSSRSVPGKRPAVR